MNYRLTFLILLAANPLFAKMRVTENAAQGQFVAAQYSNPEHPATSLTAFFRGQETACYPNPKQPDEWHCLIAVPANAVPGKEKIELRENGEKIASGKVKIIQTKFPIDDLPLTKDKKDLVEKGDSEDEVKRIRAALRTETADRYWDGEFITPVKGPIESHYGEQRRIDGKLRKNYFHRGTDFGAPKGSPMLAANNGRVLIAGPFTEEGNMVILDHGHGVTSVHMHASKILVTPGQTVKKGETIALVGSTGVSNSDHLHLGIYLHGTPIDALFWLNRKLPY